MQNGRPRVVIAAGGTGGHFYPAVALAHELADRCDLLFAIRSNDSTANRLKTERFDFVEVPAGPFFGQSPWKILRGAFRNFRGVFCGMGLLRRFRADAVIGFGAYVSVPVVLAARLLGIPVVLHEQNLVPGWANRLNALFARKVAISFAETEKYFSGKSVLTGNPVRAELGKANREESRRILGLAADRTVILVFGGSGGAKSVNAWIGRSLGNLEDLRERVQFLHLTGSSEETRNADLKYREAGFAAKVLDYSDRMGDCYASADLAVCRSGATTLSELVVTRTPAVLIPYPYATNDHQAKNARVLEVLGAARVLLESDPLLGDKLSAALRDLTGAPDRLRRMREAYARFPVDLPSAPAKLADTVLEAARK